MNSKKLLGLAALSLGIAAILSPALAGTAPGDLVEPAFKPHQERDDATTLSTPVFPLLRLVFERFPLTSNLLIPSMRLNIGRTQHAGRDRLIPRQYRDRTGTLDRLEGRTRYTVPSRRG